MRGPAEYRLGADIQWTENGTPIGKGPSGQKILTHAGERKIRALVVTEDGQEFWAETTVTVLAPLTRSRSSRRTTD